MLKLCELLCSTGELIPACGAVVWTRLHAPHLADVMQVLVVQRCSPASSVQSTNTPTHAEPLAWVQQKAQGAALCTWARRDARRCAAGAEWGSLPQGAAAAPLRLQHEPRAAAQRWAAQPQVSVSAACAQVSVICAAHLSPCWVCSAASVRRHAPYQAWFIQWN